MNFIDKIKELSSQIPRQIEHVRGNEEATKNALILPFIQALGYDVFDPTEVKPELTADVGTKKGEKVDYAILKENKPIILIECKCVGTDLDRVHASQLFRYFAVTEARFSILTNGIEFWFFTDLEAPNKMDDKPFLKIDLLNFDERVIAELKRFTKPSFDVDEIVASAKDLKYRGEIKNIITEQFTNPGEEFVRFFARQVYSGHLRQSVIEEFTGITKAALRTFIREQIENSFRSALNNEGLTTDAEKSQTKEAKTAEPEIAEVDERQIVTTQEEIEGYFIVKSILRETIDAKRITMRDTLSYCGIILDDSSRKPICRLHFGRSQKYLGLFDENKNEDRVAIDNVDDIFRYADKLRNRATLYDSTE